MKRNWAKILLLIISIVYSAAFVLSIIATAYIIIAFAQLFNGGIGGYATFKLFFPGLSTLIPPLLIQLLITVIFWRAFRKINGPSGLGWALTVLVICSLNFAASFFNFGMITFVTTLIIFALSILVYLDRKKTAKAEKEAASQEQAKAKEMKRLIETIQAVKENKPEPPHEAAIGEAVVKSASQLKNDELNYSSDKNKASSQKEMPETKKGITFKW